MIFSIPQVDRATEWFDKNFRKDYPDAEVEFVVWKDPDSNIYLHKSRWSNEQELMNMRVIVCAHVQIDGDSNRYIDIIYTEE